MENDIKKNMQNIESLLEDKQGEETLRKIKDYLEIKEKIDKEFSYHFAEIVHAKWERKVDVDRHVYWHECSNCGCKPPRNQWGQEYDSDYCPNCGAKMDLE